MGFWRASVARLTEKSVSVRFTPSGGGGNAPKVSMSNAAQIVIGREFNSRQVHHEGLPGFDGYRKCNAHAGTGAHRDENQTEDAEDMALPAAA